MKKHELAIVIFSLKIIEWGGTHILILPHRFAHTLLLGLGDCTIATTQGRLGLFEVALVLYFAI